MNWFKDRRNLAQNTSLLAAVCFAAGIIIFFHQSYKRPTGDGQAHTVIIPRGASLEKISSLLSKYKIINSSFMFIWNARLRQLHTFLKAGEYAFPPDRTLKSILALLADGRTVIRKFTAIEGQTTKEILAVLQQTEGLKGEITVLPEEGELLPETYYFSYGEQRQLMVDRMIRAHKKRLRDLWENRDPTIPLSSAQEALILATIVEKETHISQERPRIAGLFYNRLRLGMRLQSDPTVLYGLYRTRDLPLRRNLNREELETSHPFNTYLHQGLPPEPICNPSFSSLYAVLHPEKTNALYFVVDGTGGHVFSPTYEEHKRHHQALRLRRHKETRKKS